MGGVKRLAHGKVEKSEHPVKHRRKRRLFFGTLVVVPFLASQTVASLPVAKENTQLKIPATTKPEQQNFDCYKDVNYVTQFELEPNENITEVVCKKNHAFVLTDSSIIIITPFRGKEEINVDNNIVYRTSSRSYYTVTDISVVFDSGLVAWTHSEDACFFLSQDRIIRRVVPDLKEDNVDAYRLHYNVNKAKMIHHSGLLFIAPASGRMYIISFSNGYDSRVIPLSLKARDPDFFVSDGKLFFGEKKGEKIEIHMSGQGLDAVWLRK